MKAHSLTLGHWYKKENFSSLCSQFVTSSRSTTRPITAFANFTPVVEFSPTQQHAELAVEVLDLKHSGCSHHTLRS